MSASSSTKAETTGSSEGPAERTSSQQPGGAAATEESNTEAPPPPGGDSEYPEQRHAGKVGLGPNYHKGPTMGEKITGLKEEAMGTIMRKPELKEQGHDKVTGAHAEKVQEEEDAQDPFASPEDAKAKPSDRDDTEDKTGAAPAAAGGDSKRVGEDSV